jgi:hypothetical protein
MPLDIFHGKIHENTQRLCVHKARPEGSMAEDFAMDDILRFCTKYMMRFTPTTKKYGIPRRISPCMMKSWRGLSKRDQCHNCFGSGHMTLC